MSFISRIRKPKDVEVESKNFFGRFAESLTQEFEKLSLKSSKRIKGRKEKKTVKKIYSIQENQLNSLLKLKEKNLKMKFMTKEMILMFQTLIIMISIHQKMNLTQ